MLSTVDTPALTEFTHLTQAATEGRWLALEGLEPAPPDLPASPMPLLQSRQKTLQGSRAGHCVTLRPPSGPQAATEGRWLALEGLDLAPPDLLASLVPLLESRQLPAHLHGASGTCHPNFQLLATVTTLPGEKLDLRAPGTPGLCQWLMPVHLHSASGTCQHGFQLLAIVRTLPGVLPVLLCRVARCQQPSAASTIP